MLIYLLIVAIVNLGVGYLLGVALAPQPLYPRERKLATGGSPLDARADDSRTEPSPDAPTLDEPSHSDMPPIFDDEVASTDGETQSSPSPAIIETAAQKSVPAADSASSPVMQLPDEPALFTSPEEEKAALLGVSLRASCTALEVFRDRIAQLDERVQRCAAAPTADEIEGCVIALRDAGGQFLSTSQSTTKELAFRQGGEGPWDALNDQLYAALEAQAQAVQAAAACLNKLDLVDDLAGSCQKLLEAAGDLARESDQRHQQFAELRRTFEARPAEDEPAPPSDAPTAISTRAAWEARLTARRTDDPQSRETLLAGMIDIDHFSRRSDNDGGDVSAQVLAAVGQLIHDAASERTLVAHVSGQQFALLFEGDEVDEAVAEVEQMRQCLEVAQMEHEGQPIQITASCAVAKVKPDETPDQLFDRLLRTIRESKQAGESHTFVPDDEVDAVLALED